MEKRTLSLPLLLAGALVGGVLLAGTHTARAAWPPPRGADMSKEENWPNDYRGRWNYASYLPKQVEGTPPYTSADKKLNASGMSIDVAWTYTIGRDDVKIAVIDSGIHWEQADLIEKVALNMGELGGEKRPRNAAGGACGGTGPLAGFDCNGDGVFSMSDYADDARFAPPVPGEKCFTDGERKKLGPDRKKGDLNRNCALDAGDLIEMFSDNVDDDANGYKDDIAGWDFFKNDNNPYDDTRYGHGTGEARDSAAAGNNKIDDIGVCPGCRFAPLRVGDSFIADSNDFAKAVVYASDNGFKVVQEALGTINQTAFSKAAIDYAYKKGLIVMASMADENSRHHNMPAAANHVLTIHTVRYNGSEPNRSSSFLSFDTCSNYGAHLSLSISGTSCSSEATGRSSGIAGLAYSMGKQKGLDLSAEEVIQLFKMTADDIDMLEARDPDREISRRFYWSQPGFDQRFGYGRANAASMMKAIDDGLIPPEVDIVSPEWFTPVFADRGAPSIAVVGRVAASRAKSYDYKIEWAPGVQPEEKDWQPLGLAKAALPPQTVSGSDGPLATFDPRTIDTKHAPDPDSAHHENDRSMTIRLRAVAHYANGDVPGEARRTISITNEKNGLDKDLLPGFPIKVGGSAEASPKMADIDGDGVRDLIYPTSDGLLHVLTLRGAVPAEVPGFPYTTALIDGLNPKLGSEPTVPSYLSAPAYQSGAIDPAITRESMMTSPAVADLDGDGKPEIVVISWPGTIYIVDTKGKDFPGWPRRMPLVPSCPLDTSLQKPERCMDVDHGWLRGAYGAPVIVDMDGDRKPEIVVAGFEGRLHAYKLDGSEAAGFPFEVHSKASGKYNRIMTTPTVADFNGDGIPDIATGSNEQIGGGGGAGPVFIVDGRGTNAPNGGVFPNWPLTITSLKLFPVVAEGIVASQAAADFDGDGKPDVLIQGNGARPLVVRADPGPQPGFAEPPNRLPNTTNDEGAPQVGFDATSIFGQYSKAFTPDTMFPLFSQPSIGDMDQDGVPDVIMAGGSLSLAGALAGGATTAAGQHLLAMWNGKTGRMMPGAPVVVEDFTFLVNHTIADVSGDDYPEAIMGTGVYFLHAADACGKEPEGWPKFTNGWIASAAAVGDLNADKNLDVAAGTRNGWIFAWKTKGREDGVIQWESFHHDNANTGNYGTKLGQGVLKRAAKVIDCTPPPEPTREELDIGGGCVCDAAGVRRGSGPLALLLLPAAAWFVRSRRRLRK
jgi:hypothetical protein